MKNEAKKYYPMDFVEEEGKAYVLFNDQVDNLLAKRDLSSGCD
jgi:hypothetical protein